MHIEKIKINNFRNFEFKEIDFCKKTNIIRGANASGKTTILEAINLVAASKSFRANNINFLIRQNKNFLNSKIFFKKNSEVNQSILFIREKLSKSEGKNKILLNENKISISQAAQNLPIQVINQDDFFILEGKPSLRRKFLDWGVFHVKHSFYKNWKNYFSVLKQRNALLKEKNPNEKILDILDLQLIELGEELSKNRKEYLDIFKKELEKELEKWFFLKKTKIKYFSGWDEKKEFSQVLKNNRKKDINFGLTNAGPHRCDLKFEIDGINAIDFLSRGQQKIFVILLKIAQGNFLYTIKKENCIYLVDDLYAELDQSNFKKILEIFLNLENQVILTTKEKIKFFEEKINEIIL